MREALSLSTGPRHAGDHERAGLGRRGLDTGKANGNPGPPARGWPCWTQTPPSPSSPRCAKPTPDTGRPSHFPSTHFQLAEMARLRVFGPPHVENVTAPGQPLRAKAAELAVFLACHRDGADTRTLRDHLEPGARIRSADTRVHTNVSNLRHVLARAGRPRNQLTRAQTAGPDERVDFLRHACQSYTEPLAADCDYIWIEAHREGPPGGSGRPPPARDGAPQRRAPVRSRPDTGQGHHGRPLQRGPPPNRNVRNRDTPSATAKTSGTCFRPSTSRSPTSTQNPKTPPANSPIGSPERSPHRAPTVVPQARTHPSPSHPSTPDELQASHRASVQK